MSKRTKFPDGWDESRVKRVIEHYEDQSEEQAVAEDEGASEQRDQTLMEVPNELVPAVRELIAKRRKVS
jgi:type II secretory pathway component PulC